jgi:serine/threonine protein kinase
MLRYQQATFASDLWALGCIIFECMVGKPPFLGKNKYEVEGKILRGEFKFPRKFNKHAKDLVKRLLTVIPYERIGAGHDDSKNGIEALMAHPFFKGKSFKRRNKKVPSIRTLKSGMNIDEYRNYDDVYTNEENVSEDDSSSGSIRSMKFKLIKKVKRSSKKIMKLSRKDSLGAYRKEKSTFFKHQNH